MRTAGAPWLAQSNDTVVVDVNGDTHLNIEVLPYFVVDNESYQKNGENVTARFTINGVVDNEASLDKIGLFFSKNVLLSGTLMDHSIIFTVSEVTGSEMKIIATEPGVDEYESVISLGQEVQITSQNIPEELRTLNSLFVRVGVKSKKTNEYYYTQSYKLDWDN